jgi:hypothetical protein
MEVPHQYPYNPPLRPILVLFGSGFTWIAGAWLPCWLLPREHIPTGFRLWESLIGLIPIALALILGVRRIWVEHYLLLDNDSMVLPIGLFQMRTARIEYTSIRSIWRRYGPYWGTLVLGVETERQTFKVVPDFFPDNESYEALEQFLNRKALENTGAKKTSRNWLVK